MEDSTLNSQAFKIVENVLYQCKFEKLNGEISGTLNAYKYRATCYTGVPTNVLKDITIEEPTKFTCDIGLQLSVRKILKKFYSKEELPTFKDVHDLLQAQGENLPEEKEFKGQLAQLGYEVVKTIDGGKLIMENPKITFERRLFIQKILGKRNADSLIYYVAVRMYDKEKDCMVPLTKEFIKSGNKKSNPLILYHVISKEGYENGFYTHSFKSEDFMRWILQLVVPILKPSSLIVIDNHPLCSKIESKIISRYHSKKDMQKYLRNHNLPCTASLSKAELYELIEKCSEKLTDNPLDNVLKSFGHEVIHVPDEVYGLTPIELLWQNINENLKSKYIPEPIALHMKSHLSAILSSESSVNDEIERYDQVIKNAEESFLALDSEIEQYLDNYNLNFDSVICDSDEKWRHITLL